MLAFADWLKELQLASCVNSKGSREKRTRENAGLDFVSHVVTVLWCATVLEQARKGA